MRKKATAYCLENFVTCSQNTPLKKMDEFDYFQFLNDNLI